MNRIACPISLLGLLVTYNSPADAAEAEERMADAVYHAGEIYTVNADQPWAQAVAIRNGKIMYVGSDDAVRIHIGADTELYDLRGRMI